MDEQNRTFNYESRPKVPVEFRQLDATYVSVHDMPFNDAETAFRDLEKNCLGAFAHHPFAYLLFLRGIASRLMMLAIQKEEPIQKCLEYLRRRLDLEYSRGDISGKAAEAVVVANYAVKCGDVSLATAILKQERQQLCQMADICHECMVTIDRQIDALPD